MIHTNIVRKHPISTGDICLEFNSTPEHRICTECTLPKKKCNGDCKRFREEMKKLKKKQKEGK